MIGNIIDYIEWYGEVDFDAIPFNEVDNLILAELSYNNFDGVVDGPSGDRLKKACGITMMAAADKMRELGNYSKVCKLEQNAMDLLFACAKSKRFANAILSNYVDKHDFENQEQFSAMHIKLSNGVTFVSLGGTDDTILGWKEDFNMVYLLPVPSQAESVEYLNSTCMYSKGPLIVGGHSKGGNLAIYSTVMCLPKIRNRVINIYNNDGPGFLSSITEKEEYKEIKDRIITLVPENSIIGMLLEHDDDYFVVKSNGKGIEQHDGLNWQVYKNGFVRADDRNRDSRLIDETITGWIKNLEDEQKVQFVDSIYELLTVANIKHLSDFEKMNVATINVMIMETFGKNTSNSKIVRKIMLALFAEYGKNVVRGIRKKQ